MTPHHRRELMKPARFRSEEYLEAIYMLSEASGRVRVKDLAEVLGVKPPSVVDYLRRLDREGLIVYHPGRGEVRLTEEGRRIARQVYWKHQVLERFFRLLGLPEEAAEEEACRAEHALAVDTVRRIERLLGLLEKCPALPRVIDSEEEPRCPYSSGVGRPGPQHPAPQGAGEGLS